MRYKGKLLKDCIEEISELIGNRMFLSELAKQLGYNTTRPQTLIELLEKHGFYVFKLNVGTGQKIRFHDIFPKIATQKAGSYLICKDREAVLQFLLDEAKYHPHIVTRFKEYLEIDEDIIDEWRKRKGKM